MCISTLLPSRKVDFKFRQRFKLGLDPAALASEAFENRVQRYRGRTVWQYIERHGIRQKGTNVLPKAATQICKSTPIVIRASNLKEACHRKSPINGVNPRINASSSGISPILPRSIMPEPEYDIVPKERMRPRQTRGQSWPATSLAYAVS